MRRAGLWPALIALGTVLVLGFFLAIVVRNVRETRLLRDQSYQVEHTLEVQRVLDAILVAEAEADSAARAYLLTDTPSLIDSMRAQYRAADARLARLSELVRDNPAQTARLASLAEALETRRRGVEQVIAVRERGTVESAVQEARTSASTAARDEIRTLIADMESEEAHLLAVRRQEADVLYRRAVSGRVGSGIVSAVLLVAVVLIAGLHARSKALREEALVLSERRALEAAAREQEARAEAERANREKDQFLAVLSHELRTPLNAVLGWTQILQATPHDESTITRALSSIRRNAEAQHRLVEDLLDVSRIVAGKLPVEREVFDLRAAVAAAVESIRLQAESKGLRLESSLEPTPPARGDAGRMQQVAANLLSNAVKFTPAGGWISVRLVNQGDTALLEVQDNGAGIPEDLLPHVFDRFRQGDGSMTRTHGGLGLGLAIARHIVETHGGSVSAASDGPNTGATFRVCVPYG